MGAMSVRTPIANQQSAKSLWNMSLLWKLFTILVILQACGINAKELQNDLSFDDTFDIDQIDDSKLRSSRDLEEQAFIEDELQPVDEAEANSEGSWLVQSVKRVRRELGRLFGAENKQAAAGGNKVRKHHKKRSERNQAAGAAAGGKKSHAEGHKKAQQNGHTKQANGAKLQTKPKRNHKLQALNRHKKRQLFGDENEGSGFGNGDDEDAPIDDFGETDLWEAYVVVNLPWDDAYEDKTSEEFAALQSQIEAAFVEWFDDEYGYEEFALHVALMNAKRTDDYYRMHCTIQMDLPEKFGSFAQRVQHQLTSYRKMADLGMEADDQFYFRRVRDLQNHDFVDVTESGHDAQAHNNGGGAGAGAYDGHDNNNNGYYDQGHGYDANNQDNGHGYYDQENAGHGHEDGHTNAYDSTNAYDNDNNNNGYDDNNNNNGYDVYGNNNAYDPYGHGSTEDNNNNGYDNNNAYDPNDPYAQGHTEDTNNHNAYDTNNAYDPNDPYAQGHTEDNNNHNAYDPYGHGNTESNAYDNNNNGYEDNNNNNAYDPYAHDPYAHGNTHEEPEEDEDETEQEHEAPRPNIMVYDCDQNPDGDFQCANGDVIPCYKRCNNYVDCLDESDEEPDMCKVVLEREEEEIEESTNEDEDNWGSWPNVNKETSTDDSWVTPESHPDAGHHDTHAVEEEEEEKDEEEEHSPTYETIDYDRPIDAGRRVEEPVNAGGNVYGGEEDHHHGAAGGLDNNIFESSGDYSPVTETSAVFTPPTGCRGDSTYTCRESNVQICDEHLCDGVEHCPDGEDELNCGSDDEFNYEKVCSANEFMCDQRCLPMEYRCNGFNECNDGTDERDCPEIECKSTEYKCRAGNCIDSARRCDNIRDCPDGDDEDDRCPRKSCLPNEFMCENGDCLALEAVCDGTGDCPRFDDETYGLCNCEHDKFQCKRGGGCLPKTQVCDGRAQCRDGSDEMNCHFTATFNKTRNLAECLSYQFQCADGICIADYKLCNGITDCLDGSDELSCPINYDDTNYDFEPDDSLSECDLYEFECDYSRCIPLEKKCDGYPDCDDETDEIDCPPFTDNCHDNEFECDNNYCILRGQLCNGIPNCNDGTDEKNCTFCREGAYLCTTGECIAANMHCNGHNDCADGSDEHNCVLCSVGYFKCNNTCVTSNLNCDGHIDCEDGIDEQNCPERGISNEINNEIFAYEVCSRDQFQCSDFECIEKKFMCDGRPDCRDKSDESEDLCKLKVTNVLTPDDCDSSQFFCDDDCHPSSIRCNGAYDCADRTDEQDCPAKDPYPPQRFPTYPCPQHTCPNGKCYSENERCDGTAQCDDGSDELDCCAPDQFRCRNGDCIPSYYHCNGHRDCMDNSDEEECADPALPASRCLPSQFRCDNGQCISAYARCNGYVDCADSSDERYCPDSPTTPAPQLNLKTYPDNQIIKERREVIFRCRDEGMLRAKVRWTRPGGRPLPVGAVDKDGRLEIPNIRVEDGGTYVCEAVGYPRHVSGQQVSVQLTVEKYNPRDDRLPSACSAIQATCMNGECIDKSQICDGIPHCSDGSDEHSCSQGRKCQPNQFMCRNSKCVDRVWRCDGENDCGDNSDEESCDPEPSGAPCRYDEFQCRSGHCIPKSFQCDDTNDCRDGSDEIGCMAPDKLREPPPTQFLRPGDSLNLTCVGVGTPTPVIVWRLNWGHVPEKCVSKSYSGTGTLYCPDMQYGDSGAYSCEIINSKGSKFTTDTMVTVERPERPGVCSPGTFNDDAQHPSECLNCFCFGIAKSCKSSDLFISTIQPPITSHRVVNVELSPYSNIVINEAPSSGILNLRHGVQFRASDVLYGSRSTPYLALPADFMGNQLKSYGGYLKYDVRYDGTGTPTRHPDVIVTGNGFTLTYRSRSPAQPSFVNHMEIPFVPGSWTKTDGRSATREEIMMVLTNVDNVLVRLGYIEATEREVEVTNIMMTSAGPYDQGLGQASLVEKCSCPVGYSGDSCESCAPGYVRQPGGAWLGRCVPHIPEPCPEGTYGDPRRGIPCRECPCPQTGANNFATGCSLGPDNEVTCRCNEGYMGRRCETCAPGYEGNPLAPGGRCYPTPDHNCNAEGTYSILPNKTCECKSLVSGERCDTCKSGSFHLNSFTYTGCIECFCSGLPVSCGSSTWNRDQITSSFGRSRAPHGFSLIRNYNTEPAPVPFDMNGASLTFNEPSTSEPLYWSLPAQFLGNQITAYGGKLSYNLSYNPMPGGLMSRSTSPDVVIKSGEDVTLIHYRKTGFNPSQPNSYSIQMIENSWQRSDGQTVNRQHLLMALSKIDAIYIKATYTTSTKNGALTSVSMDIASPSSRSGARAWEVEECRCPPGYVGTSCERCAPGYKRNEEAGLYLGLCEPCECNGHSSQCDAETGVCLNCADNTEGDFCERCAYGYVGDATGGTPYDCVSQGSPRPPQPPQPPQNETCYHCNQAGTASCYGDYCYCKSNVQGSRCDQCRPGTYALSADNPDGCEECFCSGKSTTCSAASLYRQLIPVDFFGSPPLFTDEEGQIADRDNLNFDVARNEYTYSYTSYTPKYWSLRGSVLGNQLYSYGGELSYTLSVDSYGHYEPGNDVVLIGNGMKLIWSRPNSEQDNEEYKIRLHEDENWQTMQRGGMQRTSRLDFMNVLQNLEHILIRATPKIPTQRSSISDVILESAVETPQPGAEQAIDIEMCNCPPEYSGSSCESCAPLHYRQTDGSCRRCPCQDDNTQSCSLDERGYVKCQCRSGYAGDRCQNMEDDGSGPIISTTPQPEYKTQITVSIKKPVISIVPIGGSITLSCSGYFAYNRAPVVVTWYKLNGDMPFHYDQTDGVLRLYDLQIHDSGTYICQARNDQTQHIFQDNVTITITESSRRSPAKIDSLAPYHTFTEYVPNEIVCDVSGNPTPTVTWIRVDNQMSTEVTVEGNRLIFDRPRKSDEGRYRCQASNGEGYADEKYTEVYVETAVAPSTPAPRETVYIEPPYYAGEAGQTVRLTCHSISNINLKYEWTKDGYPIYRQHNIILLDNTLEIRDSSPRDSGTYTCVGIDMRGRRNYTSDARVNVEESRDSTHTYGTPPVIRTMREEHLVVQGHDFTITCEASGNPRPTIKWTKVHESLGDNVHQSGNVLRISSARPDNRGVYVCVAENNVASDQASTYIEIEPRERPTVDIDPKEPQVLNVGSQGMLYCTATGIPTPRVQWSRVDGLPMSPRHQMQHNEPGYIVIDNLALEDTGDYKCEATNEVGSATAISTIRVIEAPVISLQPDLEIVSVTEGDELKITCSAKGTPTPNVRWIKEDVVSYGFTPALAGAQSNEAVLEFYRVSMQDAKTYKCIATNEAGTDERYVVLDVKYRRGDVGPDGDVDDSRLPTYNPYPPPYTRPETVMETKPGENVTLICDLQNSFRTIWERDDGRPLPDNSFYDGTKLVIYHMTENSAGRYRCNSLDNRGSILRFHLWELRYLPVPRITLHPEMPIRVNVNSDVTITCNVEGPQPIAVSWHTDNNRPLTASVSTNNEYLNFREITPAAAGRYYCLASNAYGNSTAYAEVIVNRGRTYESQPQARQYQIMEGEDIFMTCDVEANLVPVRGEIHYNWRREDGQPLPPNAMVRSNRLAINNVRQQDGGRYICESYTANGVSPPSYADLYVKPGVRPMPQPYYPPAPLPHYSTTTPRHRDLSLKLDQQHSNLRVGESTEVECYSSDNSYTDVVWERADGKPLPLHIKQIGNRLIINHVTPDDAGNYLCKCKTDEGDLYTTSYELAIEANTHEWKHPKIEHAEVGSAVKLHCDAEDAHLSPHYRWSRQYGQMQMGTDILSDTLSLQNVQANDAGTYVCTATAPNGESVDYPTILVVTGAIPHFHQEPLSYMSFPTLRDSYVKFNFDITFRPEQGDGLLLFNGQKRGNGDYISLSLNDQYPEFRFDLDGKTMIVRGEQALALNEWHTIRVHRFRRDGYMQVDGEHPIAFPTLSASSSLDLAEDLYLGGVPSWDILPEEAIEQQIGFAGCISRLTLQDSIIELMKEAKMKEGITACKPCDSNPCSNSGICLESQTEMGYTCVCQQGWTGRHCAVEGTQCTPGICGTGRCENTETGMECLCPLNKTGDRCQYIEHLNENSLAFKKNSFAAYGTPRASKLNIKFQVRPNSLEDAVLLYAAESRLPSGDYVAVVLRNKHVELIINTGARLKPVVVRSLHPLPANKWTEIEIARRFGEGILRVGTDPEQKAKAAGAARTLYIKTPMYVGGFDHEKITLNRDVNITQGFDGCISNLFEGQRQLNLIADIQDAANIQNCGEINEIEQNETFDHDVEQNACSSDPCENGGTCVVENDEAVCLCNIGFAGKHCEDHISLQFDANFHGNGYLELNRSQFDENVEQKFSSAAMVFSTTAPDGLLLWWGQPKGEAYTGQDFMAVAIVDGIAEFAFRLNGEEKVIRNPDKRVDDGIRHILLIKRTDNTAILELDHILYADETKDTGKDTMSLPGHVFIGGAPNLESFTGGRYKHHFNGCVRVVEGEASGIIEVGKVAISGNNVDTCPNADEDVDFDGTEPPVV